MKRTAIHSYRADPERLIEVPKGTTKLQILLETPALFSTQSMVIGRVAAEELVEKAVTKAGAMARRCRQGLRPMKRINRGKITNMKVARPSITVRKKYRSDSML